jgi:hypothetical protein
MSTRNVTMVVHRSESEKYVKGFAVDPSDVADKSYVNMYLHHDGYPEYQGVEISNWIKFMQNDKGFTNFNDGSRIASHLVYDFHYNSQYLYSNVNNIDHQYTYIIWVGAEDVYVSCWNQHTDTCVFVSTPDKIIKKWSSSNHGYDYTDWNYKLNTNNNR